MRFSGDHKAGSKGAKLLLADPSMYTALGGRTGNIREAYVVNALLGGGKKVFACKDERLADFVVDGLKIEIGGRSKKKKAADKVVRDDVEFVAGDVVPLWCLGLLY